ncbi:MAG: hypothetical protein IT462_15505 [Planctomycetes bacterium]|nr:hypothetical protein [Planctomycetota bacterium]
MKKLVCILMLAVVMGAPLAAQERGPSRAPVPAAPQVEPAKDGHTLKVHETNDKAEITLEDGTKYTLNKDDKGKYKEEDLAKLPKWAREQFENFLKTVTRTIEKVEPK